MTATAEGTQRVSDEDVGSVVSAVIDDRMRDPGGASTARGE